MRWLDALLALGFWGLWAFLPKITTRYLPDPYSAVLFQYLGSFACVLGYGAMRGSLAPRYDAKGVWLAALAGAAATAGMAFYYRAAAQSPISTVSVTTALYPLVSVALAVAFLGERLSPRQWLGAGLALVAVALLAPAS